MTGCVPALRSQLTQPFEMASGAGHDAAVFAKMGIPTGMIFVRNDHGSHNPDEAMALDDFAHRRAGPAGAADGFSATMTLLVTGATGLRHERAGRHWLEANPDERLVVLDAAAPDAAAQRYFASVRGPARRA